MSKNVIHIYGAAGSGTSTLGKYISEQLGYYWMDTDDYFWLPTNPPYRVKREASQRLTLMRADCEKHDNVVISGSLTGWGDALIPLFTLAIRMVTPTDVRIERLKARERAHFGSRLDAGGDMHENHQAFLDWAAAYDNGGLDMRSKAEHDEWQKLLTCRRLELDGGAPLEHNLEIVRAHL